MGGWRGGRLRIKGGGWEGGCGFKMERRGREERVAGTEGINFSYPPYKDMAMSDSIRYQV